MNPLGVHALVWVAGWNERKARLALEATKDAGFDLIEIPLLDPSTVDTAMTRRLLNDYDLQATCSLGLSFDTDISSDNSETVGRGRKLLLDAVSVTRDVEATFLGGVLYSAMGKYLKPPAKAGWMTSVEVLSEVADWASESMITLGIEPVNRYESNLVNTAHQALDLANDIGRENVAVHLDAYHMNIEERDMVSPVYASGERLAYVHVGESQRGYLGSGSVDFGSFFRALVDTGYEGPVVFESFSSAVISESFCSSLGVWRDLWSDGDDLAKHARSFIQTQMAAARRGVSEGPTTEV